MEKMKNKKEIVGSDLITIKELAEVLKCSDENLKVLIRKIFPELMKNGKTTFLNKEQVIKIKIELEKQANNSNFNNLQKVFVGGEKVAKAYETTKELNIQEKIEYSFKVQADIIKELVNRNIVLENDKVSLEKEKLKAVLSEQYVKYSLNLKHTKFKNTVEFIKEFENTYREIVDILNYKDLLKEFYKNNKVK